MLVALVIVVLVLGLPATAAAGPWPRGADVPPRMERVYKRAGERFEVSPRLLAAIGLSESRHGRARLPGVFSGVNFAGCCAGPAQLCVVPSCGRVWQDYRVDGDGNRRRRVYDRDDAFFTAARYVVALERFIHSSRPRLVLAAYNAGPANVRRHGGVPPFAETRGYVARGLRLMRRLRGSGGAQDRRHRAPGTAGAASPAGG